MHEEKKDQLGKLRRQLRRNKAERPAARRPPAPRPKRLDAPRDGQGARIP